MDLLSEIIALPQKCIFGLLDYSNKRAYIGYSSNTLRTLSNLKDSNMDLSNLEFTVLEVIDSNIRLKIRYQHRVNEYITKGWTMLRDYKAVEYKLSISIRSDITKGRNSKYLVYVSLVSRGYTELVVGIFNKVEEADQFVQLHYKPITDIIYSNNALTTTYRKSLK